MKNYWVLSRPKRKLILVPDLLAIFSSIVEGEKWKGNREIQLEFEKALTDAQWKANNISKDGSGGRTYAVLLFMLGLWYEDPKDGVRITIAGQEILDGISSVEILTKQLLNYQYPSAYSIKGSVNVSKDYKIWPFRFLINILLDGQLSEITQEEIAFCIIPYAKKMNDIQFCINKIQNFRSNPDKIILEALKITETSEDNLKNISNTAINQIEYTGFFVEDYKRRSLKLNPSNLYEIRKKINDLRTSFIQNAEDEVLYQTRYGSGIKKTKDYSKSTRSSMNFNPNERKIITELSIISVSRPIYSFSDDLIDEISKRIGASKKLVKSTLLKYPIKNNTNQFYNSFIQISKGGNEVAKDFEIRTLNIYNRGFGFDSEWVGSKSRHPDIIIYLDKKNYRHGIIDTKAYKEYNLPLDHKNKMAYTYIPNFETIEYRGEIYNLAFYGYVAGGFSSTIQKSFSELVNMTNIPGHYITAENLLYLLEKMIENKINKNEIFNYFCLNQEITPKSINIQ